MEAITFNNNVFRLDMNERAAYLNKYTIVYNFLLELDLSETQLRNIYETGVVVFKDNKIFFDDFLRKLLEAKTDKTVHLYPKYYDAQPMIGIPDEEVKKVVKPKVTKEAKPKATKPKVKKEENIDSILDEIDNSVKNKPKATRGGATRGRGGATRGGATRGGKQKKVETEVDEEL